MKEFFLYLSQLINDSQKFGNVELFNEQVDKNRKGQTRARKKRSVYITFEVKESMNKDLGINDFEMNVRFTIGNDNKKFSKVEDMDLIDSLNGIIQNQTAQVDNVFSFSSMIRVFHELDTNHDQQSEPFIEYQTTLRDFSGYRRKDYIETTLSDICPVVTIVDSID